MDKYVELAWEIILVLSLCVTALILRMDRKKGDKGEETGTEHNFK